MAYPRSRTAFPSLRAVAVAAAFSLGAALAFESPFAVTASSLPPPWISTDIGAVGLAGSASVVDGVFTVKGAGADIWGTADSFHFVSQPLDGNGEVVARVLSLQNTHTYAKAGVMLRGALSAGSAHVILDVKPGGGLEFMTRATNGGTTTFIAGATASAPVWVRLVRSGNTIIGSWSTNGSAWTEVGRTTISLPALVNAGLAVTSHNTSALNTATFGNVAVSPEIPNQPPTIDITTPVNGAAFDAPATVAVSANAGDADGSVTEVQFLVGTTLLGTDHTSPYEWVWDAVAPGDYALTAIATDSKGLKTQSRVVNITVRASTAAAAPAPPSVGLPADGSTGVDPSTALNWLASQDATQYDVALGAAQPPPLASLNQAATVYQPQGALSYSTTYYWQITAKNTGGSAAGPVWSFTTRAAPSSSTTASTTLRRLRVMTWNVNRGRNAAGAVDIDAQVSLMARAGAHVVTLQDVTVESGADLPALYETKLETATGRSWDAVWAEDPRHSTSPPRGTLVLSLLPIATSEVVTLDGDPFDPSNADAQRTAARIAVIVNNVPVTIAGTTLAVDPASRQTQIRQLHSWLGSAPAPRLIGGTMNMQPGDPGYADMAAVFADVWAALVKTPDQGVTTQLFASTTAPARVDAWWQELSSTRALATEVWIVKTTRSDHHAVIAEVNVR